MRFFLSLLTILFIISTWMPATGSDPALTNSSGNSGINLYRVLVESKTEADILASSACDPLLKIDGGYLVLATSDAAKWMLEQGLKIEMIAEDINRSEIAMDMRHDKENIGRYPMLFEQGGIRLFRVDFSQIDRTTGKANIVPLRDRNIPIIFRPERPTITVKTADLVDLETLAMEVRQDSLESYSYRLEAFGGRPAGSSEVQACASWLRSKFQNFGYDSVVVDIFWDSVYGEWKQNRNVLAYKTGTLYPDFHVIFGAHYDAVPGSPGSDDNGSGTAAVIELARALADIETDVTYIFALWDAEEEGLLGSYHYAAQALSRGDRIILNVNMDMIAHYQNVSDGKVHSNRTDYDQLTRDLADSIDAINLNMITYGGGGTDYIPFDESGYDVVAIHEYIFSNVYHSYLDNTSHLNFDYMTRMARTALLTGYVIGENFVPDPELVLSAPGGLPQVFEPGPSTSVEIIITAYGGAGIVPGSVLLHYEINGGGWTSAVMSESGEGYYSGILPSLACGDRVEYYVTADEPIQGTYFYPSSNTTVVASASTGMVTVFEDDFETDKGWEIASDASKGDWELWRPSSSGVGGAPMTDYDGNRYCYLTGVGYTNDVDDGSVTLTSPLIEDADVNTFIQYARWYSNSSGLDPFSDVFNIQISNNDGTTWIPVESVGPEYQADGGWYINQFWLEDIIAPTDEIRLRFVAADNGDDSQVEAAVDAVRIIKFTFGPKITTPSLPHWTVGVPYNQQLEAFACSEGQTWVDRYGHLEGSGLSVSSSGLVEGAPVEVGVILFAAEVSDDSGRTDQSMYSFMINPALVLTTDTVPGGKVDLEYSYQLSSSGGTGATIWVEVGDNLAAVGLEITPEGLLTGIPSDTGVVTFTAGVNDGVGAHDEKLFVLNINLDYVCGDANGDKLVNVGDAVFLIAYVFSGGSAPDPIMAGDANCDGNTDVGDAVYLIAYVFNGGPPPIDPCRP